MNRPASVVLIAVVFEGLLGVLGWALCAWLDLPLANRLSPTADVWLRVSAATLPMLVLLLYVTRSKWAPIVEWRSRVEQLVGELFQGVGWFGLAIVSLAAGVGEEVLFRGALQPIAERWWGHLPGLVAASFLFAAAHAISRAYFLFALAVGLYLGWIAQAFGELITPIAVHAAYDFAALIVLQSSAAASLRRQRADHDNAVT
jgi:membrane protease YdiL (CAAX protease family)